MRIGAPDFLPYRALFFARRLLKRRRKGKENPPSPRVRKSTHYKKAAQWLAGVGQQGNMSMMRRLSYVALAIALLGTGCSTAPTQPDEPQVNLSGYPPPFRDGYADGCDSARRVVGTTRDEVRFESDSMYAAGWRDGFDICSNKKYE